MNDNPLQPENESDPFHIMLTRPSPLPPDGLELSVMEICHISQGKGSVYPSAESYFCTLVWGIKGRYLLYVDDLQFSVGTGEFLLLEPGGTLRVEAEEEDNQAYYLLLDGPIAKSLVSQSGLWSGVFSYTRSPISWLERIAAGIENQKSQENMASIAHALLVTAARDAAEHAPDKMVWNACCFLQQNWNQQGLNVEAVLNHLNVSRSTLSPRFKKVTGQSILDYLMVIRYHNALKMLSYQCATVSTIAQKCGFPDASYFSTWFRKRNGNSPCVVKKKFPS